MADEDKTIHEKLIDALAWHDDQSRTERANRITWLSQYNSLPGMVIGEADTMAMRNEADECFIGGQYIATLFLALAFIEHTVFDELFETNKAKHGDNFNDLIKKAEGNSVFPSEILDEAKQLSLIRNPFAHRKGEKHANKLGNRYLTRKVHPRSILEDDAKQAIKLPSMAEKKCAASSIEQRRGS